MIISDSDIHLSGCRHFVEQLEKSCVVYLGFIDSPFALKDSANELHGHIQSTGLFAKKDLIVGTVQQLDMIV